jgi:hypothetical protein
VADSKKYTEDPLATEDPQFLRSEEPAGEGLDYGDDPRGKIIPDSGELNISQLDAWLEEQNDEEDYITRGDLSYLQAMSIDPKGEKFTVDPDTGKIVRREEDTIADSLARGDGQLNLSRFNIRDKPPGLAEDKPKPFSKMGLAREMAVVTRLKRKYGGMSTQKIAIALGAAEMLDPIGFVDIGATMFSDELREEILYLKEKHPKTVHGIEAIGFFTGTMAMKGFAKIASKVLGPKFMKKLLATKASKFALATGRFGGSQIRAANAVGRAVDKKVAATFVGKIPRRLGGIAPKISPALAPTIKTVARMALKTPGEIVEGGLFATGQVIKNEVLHTTDTPEEDAEMIITSVGLSALIPNVFRGLAGVGRQSATTWRQVRELGGDLKKWLYESEVPLIPQPKKEFYQRGWRQNALLKILTDGRSPDVSGMDPAKANELLHSMTRGKKLDELNVWLKEQGYEQIEKIKGSSREKVASQLDYIIASLKKRKEDIKDVPDSYYSSARTDELAVGADRLGRAVGKASEGKKIKGMQEQIKIEMDDVSAARANAKIDKRSIIKMVAAKRDKAKALIKEMGDRLSKQKFSAKKANISAEDEIALIETTRANIDKIALVEDIALEGDWTDNKINALKEIMDGYNIDRKLLEEFFDVAKDGAPTNLRAGASTKRLAAYLNRLLGNSIKGLKGEAKQAMNERKLSILEAEEGLVELKRLYKEGSGGVTKKEIDEYIDYLVERKNYLKSRVPELKRAAESTLSPIPTALPRDRSSKLVKMNDVADEYNRGKIHMLTPAAKDIAEDLVRKISNVKKKLSKKNIPEAEKNRLEDELYGLLDREGRDEEISTWGLNKILDFKSSGKETKNLEEHIFQSQYLSGGTEASTLNDMRSMIKQMRDMGDNVSFKDAEDFKRRMYDLAIKDKTNYNEGYMMAAQMMKDTVITRMRVALNGMVDAGSLSRSEADDMLKRFVETNEYMSLLIPTRALSEKAADAAIEAAAGKGLEFKGIDAAGFFYNAKFPIIRMAATSAVNKVNAWNWGARVPLAASEYSKVLWNFMQDVALESEKIVPDAENAVIRSISTTATIANKNKNEIYTGHAEKRVGKYIDYAKETKAKLKNYKEAYNGVKGKIAVPETTIEEISEKLEPVFDMNPGIAGKASQRVLADLQYINDNILTKETDYFTGEPSPSVDDVYNLANTMTLLQHHDDKSPSEVIHEMIEKGSLDSRTAKTYRDLRPNMYRSSVKGIMQAIAKMRAEGKTIPYNVQMAITNLMPDLDFSNPSIGVLTGGILQIVHTNDDKAQPTGEGKTDIGSTWATGSQEIEKRQGRGKSKW